MISVSWEAQFPNAEAVKADWTAKGGSIVIYRDVWSLLSFTKSEPKLIHVLPSESRVKVGLRESRRMLWAGWWALLGFAEVASALTHNLSGGIDVTRAYGYRDEPLSSEDAKLIEEQLKLESKRIGFRSRIAFFLSIAIAGCAVYFF